MLSAYTQVLAWRGQDQVAEAPLKRGWVAVAPHNPSAVGAYHLNLRPGRYVLLIGSASPEGDNSDHTVTVRAGETVTKNLYFLFHTAAASSTRQGPLHPTALAVGPNGDLYVADSQRDQVLERHPDGSFSVAAGSGTTGFSGDGGLAPNAALSSVSDITFSPNGDLYIADGPRVRAVGDNGIITTVVGSGRTPSSVASGTPALEAALGAPLSLAFSPSGVLYVTTSIQVASYTVTGTEPLTVTAPSQLLRLDANSDLDPVPAVVRSGPGPTGNLEDFGSIAVDGQGNIFVASGFSGWSVYRIDQSGTATYLGYARRSGGNTTIVARGPGDVIEVDSGPGVLQVQGDSLVKTSDSYTAQSLGDFNFVAYIAVGADGPLYEDNLNGPFDPFQQIVQVAHGRVSSLWHGPSGPR